MPSYHFFVVDVVVVVVLGGLGQGVLVFFINRVLLFPGPLSHTQEKALPLTKSED